MKMLRMCVSIVFSLRNSVAAISRFVLRSVTSNGDLELAPGQCRHSGVVRGGRAARLGAGPEASQLAPDLVAHAQRAAAVELALGPPQQRDRPLALSRRGDRATAEGECECGRQSRAGGGRRLRGLGRQPRRLVRLVPGEQHRRPRAQGERGGQAQVELRGVPLGATDVAVGGVRISARELDERQDLPVEALLHGDLVRQLVTSERVHDLPGALHLARLEQGDAEDPARAAAGGGHRGARHPAADPRALLGGRDRGLEVAG